MINLCEITKNFFSWLIEKKFFCEKNKNIHIWNNKWRFVLLKNGYSVVMSKIKM